MLVLHPSSRCDVCLSEYSWDNSSARPYAIHCGHIFCRDCLYTTTPPLCPLCRKPYQPNKMKKLHVDRPDNIDDHKEIDLLQRLAISWETAPDQLDVVVNEVDLWLRSRSDDSCIPLRKARAALDDHLRLKDSESEFDETVESLEQEIDRLESKVVNEGHKLKVAYQHTIDELQSYVVLYTVVHALIFFSVIFVLRQVMNLNVELDRFRVPYGRHTRSHNPLPAPPEPISTDYIPTFEQAVLSSGASSTRYPDLPTSPMSSPPQFEIERRNRKGKTRLPDRQYVSDPRYQTPGPSVPSSHYAQPRPSPQPPAYGQSSSYTTRTPGLQYDFDNTNQPLDAFGLTHAYLKEYSVGFVNGQALANGRRATELLDNRRAPTSQANSRQPPQTAGVYESSSNSRDVPVNAYQNQPYSAPVAGDRPSHRRHDTAPSVSSSRQGESSTGLRPQSRQRGWSSGSQDHQHTNAALASILSPPRPPSRRQSAGQPTPNSRSVSFQSPVLVAEPEPLEETMLPSNPVAPNLRRGSPFSQSRETNLTWGTPTPSGMTRGSMSMIPSLLNFRNSTSEGGETSFHISGSDGGDRRASIISTEAAPVQASPARPVHSMVGVLPGDAEVVPVSSHSNRNSYRSPNTHSTHSNGWEASTSSNSRAPAPTYDSGYQPNEDRSQNQRDTQTLSSHHRQSHQSYPRDDGADSHRSPTSNSYFYSQHRTQTHNESLSYQHQSQDDSSDRQSHSRYIRAPRTTHLALLPESPFPITVDYAHDDRGSPRSGPSSVVQSFGNALGLEMPTGPAPISAPTPIVSNTMFLRTFSRDRYES